MNKPKDIRIKRELIFLNKFKSNKKKKPLHEIILEPKEICLLKRKRK